VNPVAESGHLNPAVTIDRAGPVLRPGPPSPDRGHNSEIGPGIRSGAELPPNGPTMLKLGPGVRGGLAKDRAFRNAGHREPGGPRGGPGVGTCGGAGRLRSGTTLPGSRNPALLIVSGRADIMTACSGKQVPPDPDAGKPRTWRRRSPCRPFPLGSPQTAPAGDARPSSGAGPAGTDALYFPLPDRTRFGTFGPVTRPGRPSGNTSDPSERPPPTRLTGLNGASAPPRRRTAAPGQAPLPDRQGEPPCVSRPS
jgi:hypothetical protein